MWSSRKGPAWRGPPEAACGYFLHLDANASARSIRAFQVPSIGWSSSRRISSASLEAASSGQPVSFLSKMSRAARFRAPSSRHLGSPFPPQPPFGTCWAKERVVSAMNAIMMIARTVAKVFEFTGSP